MSNNDIPQGRGNHTEIGGKTTLCFNVVKNEPMWQYLKIFVLEWSNKE